MDRCFRHHDRGSHRFSNARLEIATKSGGERVLRVMKTRYFVLCLLAANGLLFSGCASDTTASSPSQVDQTEKRVHTQDELRKSGQSETGPALEQTDPAIRMSGPH
jgi:hypothetical protein